MDHDILMWSNGII